MRGRPWTFTIAMVLLIGLAIAQVAVPDRSFSDMENRPLAQLDTPTASTILSGRWMDAAETYAADQFPARDGWMSLQALSDAALLKNERNGILIGRNGWLFERAANLDLTTARRNVVALDALDTPVTLLVVPLSSAVYADALPRWYIADDAESTLASLTDGLSQLRTVDMLGPLRDNADGQPLYFRTDHHWTQAGANVAYDALAEAWGFTPDDPGAVDLSAITYGTYYARAPSPLITGDLFGFDAPEGVRLLIEGEPVQGLYDASETNARDRYARLLYGNHGHITLESDASGGTLLVIKDSYANMLLPQLARQYSRIEAIDPRYFAGDLLATIEETEADAILCVYGLTTLLSDRSLLLQSAAWE